MSNTPNLRYQRKVLVSISSLKNRDRRESAINDCKRPSRGATKEDLLEIHREKVALQMARRRNRTPSRSWPASGSIAQGNRHGGPHHHSREIDRHRRPSTS